MSLSTLALSPFENTLIILVMVVAIATSFTYYIIREFNLKIIGAFVILFLAFLAYWGVIDSIFKTIAFLLFAGFVVLELLKRKQVILPGREM